MRRALPLAAVLLLALVPTASAHSLTFGRAMASAQAKGDQVAGQRVEVSALSPRFAANRHRHTYDAGVKWERIDPAGCKGCGFDPETFALLDTPSTDFCSADLRVRFRSARSRSVTAVLVAQRCF